MCAVRINSHQKGAAGEREWARFCREQGYKVRRTAQYCGMTGDASDCVGLEGIHQEVKRVERLNIHNAMEQAVRDCNASQRGEIPIVAHRKNRSNWLVSMRAEDWFQLYKVWCSFSKDKNLFKNIKKDIDKNNDK